MITVNKRKDAPLFGELVGDWRIPLGELGSPDIRLSQIGRTIRKWIKKISSIIPNTRLFQYKVMPDHIHFLIFVQERTPYHLGKYISAFKNYIRMEIGCSVFQTGFNDKILSVTRRLDDIFHYIRENPYRLAIKKANPDNFRRCDNIKIRGKLYTGYGNLFLLKNPFRDVVIVHRKSSDEEKRNQRERWLHASYSGGVLVSPFISPEEKEIRNEVEKFGGRVVLIVDKPLPPSPWKPAYRDFYRCARGELLILAPIAEEKLDLPEKSVGERRGIRDAIIDGKISPAKKNKILRGECLRLNALAEYICSDKFNSKIQKRK
ncbi:MAG: hypothetical protein K2M16_02135 [Muribaculaceae bacterium]|nr:hypothetical protein [Muribaculaceae bacterium]